MPDVDPSFPDDENAVLAQIVTPDAAAAVDFILAMRVHHGPRLTAALARLGAADDPAGACGAKALSALQVTLLAAYSEARGAGLKLTAYFLGRQVARVNRCQEACETGVAPAATAVRQELATAFAVLDALVDVVADTGSEHAFWRDPAARARFAAAAGDAAGAP